MSAARSAAYRLPRVADQGVFTHCRRRLPQVVGALEVRMSIRQARRVRLCSSLLSQLRGVPRRDAWSNARRGWRLGTPEHGDDPVSIAPV